MSIAENKKAFHDYFIEEKLEAGLVLEGWEVKSIRAGRAQLKEAYVIVKDGEVWLLGCHISPLTTASTHVKPDPVRTRKVLLHEREIARPGHEALRRATAARERISRARAASAATRSSSGIRSSHSISVEIGPSLRITRS